jgi:hypothetical protein
LEVKKVLEAMVKLENKGIMMVKQDLKAWKQD